MKIDRLLSDKEEKAAVEFFNDHSTCYGGTIIIKLEQAGGLGIGVTIKCKKCKAKRDITDYDCW